VKFSNEDAKDVLSWVCISEIPQSSYELSELTDLDYEKVEAVILKLEADGLITRNDERFGRVSWSPNRDRR